MSRVSGKPYFVYILWSVSAARFYIGISEDPEARLLQHNSGLSKWTARHIPWTLVRVEAYPNYSDARQREITLKKQKGGVGFYALTGLDASQFRRKATSSGS
jgi:putative endonuclease